MAFVVGEVSAPVTADATQFGATMNKVKAQGANVAAGISKKFAEIGRQMEKVGKTLTKSLTVPLLGVGVAAFKMGKDFENEMQKIVGLVGVAQEQVDLWGADLLEMAPQLGKAPKELAEALFFVTSAGLRGAAAMDVLEKSAKASAAGMGETKVIADLVTSAVNAYGSESLSAAEATDILVNAVRQGKAEAPELAASLGSVLPIAAEMGVSFDQVAASVAAMTRTGTDATQANTQLKAILVSLLKPAKQAEEALNMMGVSSKGLREEIREKGLMSVLEKLRLLTNKYGEEVMAQVFPNIRALAGSLDLMGANAAENIAIFDSLKNSTGLLDAAFEGVAETAEFKWQKTISQVQSSMITLWDTLKGSIIPIIEQLGKKIKETTEWFQALEPQQRENIVKFAAIALAIGPVLIVGAKLITVIGGIGKALMFLAANPILLAIGVIVAAIGGIAYMATTTSKKVQEATEKKIAAYKKLAEEGLKAVDELHKGEIEALEEKVKEEDRIYQENKRKIEKGYLEEIEAAEEKTESVIEGLEEEQKELDKRHNDAIKKIREEYGVVERITKNKVELVRDYYQTQIEEAQKAHNVIMSTLDEELQRRKGTIDREGSLVIGEMQDRISLLDGATKEEVALEKKKRLENRAIALEAMIAAETDVKAREALVQEREDIIRRIIGISVNKELDLKKWAIREEILEEKKKIAKRKLDLDTQYMEDKKVLDAALLAQVISLEGKRDDEIELIQEEREAKETAEIQKYEATKQSLEDQITEQQDYLEDYRKELAKEYDAKLLHEADLYGLKVAELELELAAVRKKVKDEKKIIEDAKVANIEETKEDAKSFKNTKLGETLGEAQLLPFLPKMKDIGKPGAFKEALQLEKLEELFKMPQYASGTAFHPGGPAIVGEQGLEVIDLPKGSSVTPIMGGDNIGTNIGKQSIHINVTGGWDAREMANKIVRELRFLGVNI